MCDYYLSTSWTRLSFASIKTSVTLMNKKRRSWLFRRLLTKHVSLWKLSVYLLWEMLELMSEKLQCHWALTLCPFMPGSPGVPGKPRAPCRRKSNEAPYWGRYKHAWFKEKKYSLMPHLWSRCSSISRFSRSAIVTLREKYKRGGQNTVQVIVTVLARDITALTSSPFLPGGPGGPRAPIAPCYEMTEGEKSAFKLVISKLCETVLTKNTYSLSGLSRLTSMSLKSLRSLYIHGKMNTRMSKFSF